MRYVEGYVKQSFRDIEKKIIDLYNINNTCNIESRGMCDYTEGFSHGYTEAVQEVLEVLGIDIEGVTYEPEYMEKLGNKYEIGNRFTYETNNSYHIVRIDGISDNKDKDGNIIYFVDNTKHLLSLNPVEDIIFSSSTYEVMTDRELNRCKKLEQDSKIPFSDKRAVIKQ